jgi:hypothetical protein
MQGLIPNIMDEDNVFFFLSDRKTTIENLVRIVPNMPKVQAIQSLAYSVPPAHLCPSAHFIETRLCSQKKQGLKDKFSVALSEQSNAGGALA